MNFYIKGPKDNNLRLQIAKTIDSQLFDNKQLPDYVIKPIDVNSLSKTYRCQFISSRHEDLFIKSKSDSLDDERTKKEYDLLRKLWLKYKDEKVNIVAEPILYNTDGNFLITKFIQGVSFSKKLAFALKSPFFFFYQKILEEDILRISEWLLDFEKKFISNNFSSSTKSIDFYFKKIESISFLEKEEISKIQNRLTNVSKIFDKIPCHITNIDFNPTNTLINKKSIAIIDWEKRHDKGLVFWMLSSFTRYLDTLSSQVLVRSQSTNRLIKTFEDNYFSKTIFKEYKIMYPLIQSFDYIVAISESKNSILKQKPSKKNLHMLKKLNKILSIN